MSTINKTENDNLKNFCKELSIELAANYYSVSLGKSKDELENDLRISKIFDEKHIGSIRENLKRNELVRNILIIGAGASYDAYKDILLANSAVDILEDKLGLNRLATPGIEEKYSKAIENAVILQPEDDEPLDNSQQSERKKKDLDFETYLSIFSQITSVRSIREELQRIYGHRYCPSFFYEIIAHLFKHRFIDVIINFNFDELLEQAIEEEIGIGDYNSIISDGHCLEIDELTADGMLKVPLYIKPHGTASHKSTLRFTKDQYFDIPSDISNLIAKIVAGDTGGINDGRTVDRVNLIVVGFGMASIEFNHILKTYLPVDSKIWYVAHKKVPKYNKEILNSLNHRKSDEKVNGSGLKDKNYHIVDLATDSLITERVYSENNDESYFTPLGILAETLWQEVENKFVKSYKPKGILRHHIIASIFYDYNKYYRNRTIDNIRSSLLNPASDDRVMNYFGSADYYFSRAIIDFALALIKHKGKIEIRRLMEERTGVYFDLFRSKQMLAQHRMDKKVLSIFDVVGLFELEEKQEYARTIYNIPGIEEQEPEHEKGLYRYVMAKLEIILKDKKNLKNSITLTSKSKSLIEDYYSNSSKTYTITPKFKDKNLYIFDTFSREKVLHTNLALRYRYLEFFNQYTERNKWDLLLVISENGNIFNGFDREVLQNSLANKKVVLITANQNHLLKYIDDDHLYRFNYKGKTVIPYLPYWFHNHHMAIFMNRGADEYVLEYYTPNADMKLTNFPKGKEKKRSPLITEIFKKFFFIRSIYFKKSGFSTQINPIYVDHNIESKEDHKMLLEAFLAYFIKSWEFFKSDDKYIINIKDRSTIYSEQNKDVFSKLKKWLDT